MKWRTHLAKKIKASDKGCYQTELIFSDKQLAERLRKHPVPLWKAVKVYEHNHHHGEKGQ